MDLVKLLNEFKLDGFKVRTTGQSYPRVVVFFCKSSSYFNFFLSNDYTMDLEQLMDEFDPECYTLSGQGDRFKSLTGDRMY